MRLLSPENRGAGYPDPAENLAVLLSAVRNSGKISREQFFETLRSEHFHRNVSEKQRHQLRKMIEMFENVGGVLLGKQVVELGAKNNRILLEELEAPTQSPAGFNKDDPGPFELRDLKADRVPEFDVVLREHLAGEAGTPYLPEGPTEETGKERLVRWMRAAGSGVNALLSGVFGRRTNASDLSTQSGALTPDEQAREVNAPLDPFGRRPDAQDLARTFSFLRASFVVTTDRALSKFEDLVSREQQGFFRPDEPPAAVLFLSHRWETPEHPDPLGRQADCIRMFLKAVDDIVRTGSLSAEERGACVPSLLSHGRFQAAYFVDNGIAFSQPEKKWHEHWKSRAQNSGTAVREYVLDHIGVWYDYACLPQEDVGSQRLADSLFRIHELIGECTMLVLRYPGDDYECRSWCASELAIEPNIERHACRKIVLRLDKLVSRSRLPTSRVKTVRM